MTYASSLVTDYAEPISGSLKRCPRCPSQGREAMKPIGAFGICRARPDGLNLYCKRCIREKISASRLALREYKQMRKRREQQMGQPSLPPRKEIVKAARHARYVRQGTSAMSDKVLRAIDAGAATQSEIRRLTKLSRDTVSDALAELMCDRRQVATRLLEATETSWTSEHRIYFRVAA
jgi:delta 1-pyrroline-5-carboxylate dehydrogenase